MTSAVSRPASRWNEFVFRVGIGGGLGAILGFVAGLAALCVGGTDWATFDPRPSDAGLLLAATIAAAISGTFAFSLTRRWPVTSIVVMICATLAAAISIVWVELRPIESDPTVVLIGGFLFPFAPLVAPVTCLCVAAGSVAWVAAVRFTFTGSLRVEIRGTQTARDLLVALASCAVVWGPAILLALLFLSESGGVPD